MEKIPLSKCFVNAEVEEAALRALRSGQYILGQECQAFEAELAAHTGTAHCVLGSSWTMIVYLLHQLQGLGPGDEVIVPSLTYVATANAVTYCGATPVFADSDAAATVAVVVAVTEPPLASWSVTTTGKAPGCS